jgi:hypothetical protein
VIQRKHSDLIYHAEDHTFTYRPTKERFPAETLDEFANQKLQAAIDRLARVVVEAMIDPTNGS